MTRFFLRRAGLVFLFFVSLGTSRATAEFVYLNLVINPPTTAGFGVPTIPRADSIGTFSVTSNKSGPGTFHLYAMDPSPDSFGIAYFNVALNGTVSNVVNRSPIASFDTVDDTGETVGGGNAGFSLSLLRSGVPPTPSVPVQGSQDVGSPHRIGLGRTAGSFNDTPNLPAVPAGGARSWSAVVSSAWGNYATAPAYNAGGKSWLLLGEGNYTGSAPTLDYTDSTTVLSYASADFNSQKRSKLANDGQPFPRSQVIDNVNANEPGSVNHTFTAFNWADFWSDFRLISYTPNPSGSGSGPAFPATFDPETQKFAWSSLGSPTGTYIWGVKATNMNGSNQATLRINVTAVPEPATISLLVLALVAFSTCNRRPR